jgi:hypothetical protein
MLGDTLVLEHGDEDEPGYGTQLLAIRGVGKRRRLTCVERTSSARSER